MFKREYKTFLTEGTPAEACARLDAALPSSRGFLSRGVMGWISEERVVLQKKRPLTVGGTYMFSGRFTRVDDGTVLSGYFAPSLRVKIFAYLWFGIVLVGLPAIGAVLMARDAMGVASAHGLSASFMIWMFFFGAGLIMAGAGYLIIRLELWLERSDISMISDAIMEGLRSAV